MARFFNPNSLDLCRRVGNLSSKSTFISKSSEHKDKTEVVPQYPTKPRIKSGVNFDKQTSRPDHKGKYDAHPLRFVSFNHNSLVSSRTKKIATPNISKFSPRKSSISSKDLDYNVNPKRTEKLTISFEKTLRRGPLFQTKEIYDLPRNLSDFDAIDKHVPIVHMAKDSNRPNHEVLPGHMVKIHHRRSLQSLSQKSLEMNSFFTNDYLELSSSFGKGWFAQKFKNKRKGRNSSYSVKSSVKRKNSL